MPRRHDFAIDRATVRRWALREGLAPLGPRKKAPRPVRRWQVQHAGQRFSKSSTFHSRVIPGARLYECENLPAHLDFLPAAFRAHGLPLALHVDCHAFFFTSTPDALTQLGAALRFSEISLRYATTPQAKGKIERAHDFWLKRLPPLFAAEHVATLPEANLLLEKLRVHHNQKELHRELRSTPQAAWNLALNEERSVLRPAPNCPWWPSVWSPRSQAKVGPDGRISSGSQRLRIEGPCGSAVTRCLHPNGDVSALLHPPSHGQLPILLLHLPAS